jgi:hypothetical protein
VTALAPVEYQTIGEFYRAIRDATAQAGDSIITGDPARQLTSAVIGLPWVMPVVDVESASLAIDHIFEQGEGTTESPTEEQDRLAHYYRFAEIYHERELIPDPSAPPNAPPEQRYRYGVAPIRVDPTGIYPLRINPRRQTILLKRGAPRTSPMLPILECCGTPNRVHGRRSPNPAIAGCNGRDPTTACSAISRDAAWG